MAPGRVELPTFGLGNRCSIHLSYGANAVVSQFYTATIFFLSAFCPNLEHNDVHKTPLSADLAQMEEQMRYFNSYRLRGVGIGSAQLSN